MERLSTAQPVGGRHVQEAGGAVGKHEQEAKGLADKLAKALSKRYAAPMKVETLPRALEIFSPSLPAFAASHWRDYAPESEEDEVEDGEPADF